MPELSGIELDKHSLRRFCFMFPNTPSLQTPASSTSSLFLSKKKEKEKKLLQY